MNRHAPLRWLAVLAAALMLALPAVPAYAAPARLAKYDVRAILTSDGQRALLVSAELPADAQLPAEVAVAVPKGASLSWVGEILGGDASKDPEAKYTVQPGSGYDTVVFTLKQARVGQAELLYPQGQSAAGAATKAVLDYVPNLPAPAADLSIEVPTGAKVSGASDGLKQISVGGGTFFQKSFTNVKAGQKLSASLQYTGGTIAPPQQQSGGSAPQQVPQQGSPVTQPTSSSGPASLPIVLIVLVAIIAGTYFMMKRVSQSAAPEQEPEPATTRRAKAEPAEAERHAAGADYFDDEESAVGKRRKAAPTKPATAKSASARKDGAKKSASAAAKSPSGKKASNASNPSAKTKRSA